MPTYRHRKFGRVVVLPYEMPERERADKWERIPDDPMPTAPDSPERFDPTRATVAEVRAHLAVAGPEERARVMGMERRGKRRKSIVGDEDEAPPIVVRDEKPGKGPKDDHGASESVA